MACTTILVGKDASYDGSTIIARNEDSANGEFNPKRFVVIKPEDQPRHYRSVLSHVEVELPSNPMQYTSMPNADTKDGIWGEAGVNEANVAMSATETLTTNERVLGADPFVELAKAQGKEGEDGYVPEVAGGIGEEDFLTIVLPYIKTAREGVKRLGSLLEQYGTYEMNGVAFSDSNEIWWLETVGGHHWIAKRVPDEAYVTMPNQLGIDEFDLEDALGEQENCMCSADLNEFIEANHLDLAVEATTPFNPRDAFGSHSDSDHVYNTPRAWFMQRFLNPYDEVWDGPEADHTPESDDIPWARQPERKVTIEDVKYVLSSHYQGTPYDPYGHRGDEHTRHMYRTIGINRQSQLSVIQIRPYRPQSDRAIQWISYGSNPFNALVPLYPNVDTTPAYLEATTTRVTSENFYWANRIIAALCDSAFAKTANAIERYQELTGGMAHRMVAATDEQVAKLGGDKEATAESMAQAELNAGNPDGDVEPMEPDQVIAATRNAEVREILCAANQSMADQIKKETDSLLDTVLYTVSMGMSNGFDRSDN
ncbi:C69 family dipeptidase [Bifidobacterium sp. ESL0798]|uniref:C69 family dipeptidase n=1 Tax=Bifidobacterium sp. ESL0798 TaxID=2983235 RepID=UPI0023F64A42|nr:C69 family dipeptidase [Bifidobacterium sp. ESL0798]WEV74178.1 C69 family dipeptidase [Bifidobacterium sp. ESL0798]